MSFDIPPFQPRFPWWGGDLQTLANRLAVGAIDLAPHTSRGQSFRLDDGTGDTLLARLDRPARPRAGAPLVILIHGLTGSQDSTYMLSQSRCLLEAGFRVLRLNLRGAGPSRALCGGHYYAGRSQDFRALLALLPDEFRRDGVAAVGYSLGGAMLLKYLGEEGRAAPLVAAASVSAPIDLAATCQCMLRPRNALYHRYLLAQMKGEATGEGAVLTDDERHAVLGARSIWEYDEVFIAPRHGFAGADDYYDRCKPVRFMPAIGIPTLVIAALDDPWIPGDLYKSFGWAENPLLTPLLSRNGGHVGFHGRGDRRPWSDIAIVRFLEHV
ncbi:MAG: alpha/beta fold hydrolase [Enhydrobacter sp.]|nr:MAG: alpha/beta fold hydrolase [Enhydrobacter sp.]